MIHGRLLVHARRALAAAALGLSVGWLASTASATGDSVALNTKTLKYHCPSCEWAVRCTRNCITVTQSEAEERGAVPCKVCNGRCR
ncbi:MAG TPA: hypothetical protein VNN80_08465 [Polyangiaceae bacterium]|jgi:hypothetical protein|nr:hypothetical protein [Polyangiaceae bacterium]